MNLSLDNLLTPHEDDSKASFVRYQLLWAEHDNALRNPPLRLNADCKGIHVIAGAMWVTLNGEDHIVESNATIRFLGNAHQALISNMGECDLIFELL